MTNQQPSGVERRPPIGVRLSVDIEAEAGPRGVAYKARARWIDPVTGRRVGLKRSHTTLGEAERWLESLEIAAATGIDPGQTLATLVATIGDRWARAIDRTSTYDPYSAGLRLRVLPKLGHLPHRDDHSRTDRPAIDDWELLHGRSTVKNTVSVLVLVLDEAVRDGLLARNPAKDRARRRTAGRAIEADEPASPRDLALPDVETLNRLVESVDAAGGHDAYGDTVTVLATSGAAHQWGRRVARWRHRPCSRPHPRRSSDLPRARGSRDEADQGPAEKDRSDNRSPATDSGTPDGWSGQRRAASRGTARWCLYDGDPSRRNRLGRTRPRPRTPRTGPPRTAAHRADMDGRRRHRPAHAPTRRRSQGSGRDLRPPPPPHAGPVGRRGRILGLVVPNWSRDTRRGTA